MDFGVCPLMGIHPAFTYDASNYFKEVKHTTCYAKKKKQK